MSYSIPSSTKTFTLTTTPFLFILVGAQSVCQFAIVLGVYILLYFKEYTLPKGTYTHIPQHTYQKVLKSCLSLYYYGKVIAELEKKKTRN